MKPSLPTKGRRFKIGFFSHTKPGHSNLTREAPQRIRYLDYFNEPNFSCLRAIDDCVDALIDNMWGYEIVESKLFIIKDNLYCLRIEGLVGYIYYVLTLFPYGVTLFEEDYILGKFWEFRNEA
jgi:hypothetical protein